MSAYLDYRLIQLGMHKIRVNVQTGLKLDEQKVNGYFCPTTLAIWIEWDLNESVQKEILLHELLHACWWSAQLTDKSDEEQCVSRIAPILGAALIANPWIYEWMKQEDFGCDSGAQTTVT